jgi:hypothetical protein
MALRTSLPPSFWFTIHLAFNLSTNITQILSSQSSCVQRNLTVDRLAIGGVFTFTEVDPFSDHELLRRFRENSSSNPLTAQSQRHASCGLNLNSEVEPLLSKIIVSWTDRPCIEAPCRGPERAFQDEVDRLVARDSTEPFASVHIA